MKKLLAELEPENRQIYELGYLDGKEKGTMKGFAIGAVVGMIMTMIGMGWLIN